MAVVSVVIPSYNHEKYVSQAVQSVLCQSLRDLELIVVDDGSTDDSLRILRQFSDPRLNIISQSNQGAHAAINRGLELATGEYLAILNSDDVYHPDRLEKLIAIFKKYPGAGLVGSYIQVINSDGNILGIKHGYHDLEPWALRKPERSFRSGEDLRLVLLTENYWATTSNYLFSRTCLNRVGPFRPLRYAHDWDFALRMAQEAKLLMVPEALLSYRVHQTNTIKENQAAMIFEICWILAVHLPQAIHSEWFQAKNQNTRLDQLLNSIYVFQCERILSLMLLQDLSRNTELALDLLRKDHPLRISYEDFISSQLDDSIRNEHQAQPNALPDNSIFKELVTSLRNGLSRKKR